MRIPHRAKFNPADRNRFEVSVFVRPDNSAAAPTSQLAANASPNIVQKGLVTDSAQWKISMRKNMTVVCSFKGMVDGAATTRNLDSNAISLRPNLNYSIECGWEPRLLSLRIVEIKEGSPDETVFNESTSFTEPMSQVANNAAVWVGKKPASTDADDAFAGAIDNLTIRRSAA